MDPRQALLSLKETERDCVLRYGSLLAERLGENLVQIWLFGSAARDDMWPDWMPMHSDIDLLILSNRTISRQVQEEVLNETYPLFLECGRQIAPQFRTMTQFHAPEDERTRDFMARVRAEGRVIYEHENTQPLPGSSDGAYHLLLDHIMPEQTKVLIRRIQPGDESALVEFYNGLSTSSKRTFRPLGSVTNLEDCEAILQENSPEVGKKFDLVAVRGTRIVGWGFLWNLESEEPTFGLGIADAVQGKGLGSALMDGVMKAARERGLRKVFLTVVKDNEVAWKMYEKRGFVRDGEYYDAKDALPYFRMAAELETGLSHLCY